MRPAPAHIRVLLLAMGLLFTVVTTARAQAVPLTAFRSAEISAFAELSVTSASFCSPCTNTGVVLGADYTRFSPRFFNPSLEIRGALTSGSLAGESSVAAGLRLHGDYGRLRPYLNLLAGLGAIHYNPPFQLPDGSIYDHDNSAVFQFGGGLQYAVTSRWALQAEVQAQRWNLGSDIPVIFHPLAVNLGINYRIPFRPFRNH